MVDEPNTDTAVSDAGAMDFEANPIDALAGISEAQEREDADGDKAASDKQAPDTTVPAHIQAAIDKANDTAIQARQENQFLRGQLSELKDSNRPPEVKAAEPEPIFKLPTREEIQSKL